MKNKKPTYIILTEANFQKDVLESKLPVLVEFVVDWSGSCQIIAPALEEMEAIFESRVKFCQVDVEQQGELAKTYGVQKIPTILFFKGGEQVDKQVGAVPKQVLEGKLQKLI